MSDFEKQQLRDVIHDRNDEISELRGQLVCAQNELVKVQAERDDLKAELQLVREQTAKAARIMIEEAEREAARRAVEVCDKRKCFCCAEEIESEFNSDQARDSSPVGSETGEKHAQTAENDK